MRTGLIFVALGLAGCAVVRPTEPSADAFTLRQADRLIDSFYSFDGDRLRNAMAHARQSQPQILYYQGWAQGGNYRVLKREPCRRSTQTEIACSITVRDDLIEALGTGYWVTDTFHLTVDKDRIVKVRTSSNDPPQFDVALDWIKKERPEVMSGPCQGFFAGGPTPQACVKAIVGSFAEWRKRNG